MQSRLERNLAVLILSLGSLACGGGQTAQNPSPENGTVAVVLEPRCRECTSLTVNVTLRSLDGREEHELREARGSRPRWSMVPLHVFERVGSALFEYDVDFAFQGVNNQWTTGSASGAVRLCTVPEPEDQLTLELAVLAGTRTVEGTLTVKRDGTTFVSSRGRRC